MAQDWNYFLGIKAMAGNFDADFRKAYKAAYNRTGINLVKMETMRQAMKGYSRAAFDAGVQKMRGERSVAFETTDGRHDKATPGQVKAAIAQNGRVYTDVSAFTRGGSVSEWAASGGGGGGTGSAAAAGSGGTGGGAKGARGASRGGKGGSGGGG